jgi:restriction system protein
MGVRATTPPAPTTEIQMQADPYHFPPDVLVLLKDTIARLVKSKRDVIDFFRGAGVPESDLADLRKRVEHDKDSISKFEIARVVLTRLCERGDSALGQRREVIRRVVEWEDFSSCWPNQEMEARGFVAEMRRIVDTKDSFTRMNQERERERRERLAPDREARAKAAQRRTRREDIRRSLARLRTGDDPHRRGHELEKLINELFSNEGILIRESFNLYTDEGAPAEQIDGVIDIDGKPYLVEVKWWADPLDVNAVSRHLSRVFVRGGVGGFMISGSGYTSAGISVCEAALSQKVFVLADLRELELVLERGADVAKWFRDKIQATMIQRKPLVLIQL